MPPLAKIKIKRLTTKAKVDALIEIIFINLLFFIAVIAKSNRQIIINIATVRTKNGRKFNGEIKYEV